MRRSRALFALLSTVVLLASVAERASAQDVQYTSVTKVDLGGVINALAKLGGSSLEVEEKTYIKGARMRTDSEGSSTIMDFENNRYIFVDHDAKTYSVVTLEQMVESVNQAAARASEAQGGGKVDNTIHTDSGDVTLDFDLDVKQTGESEKINGWNARRALVTMRTDATVKQEGQPEEEAGSLVIFTDIWTSTDVPAYTAQLRLAENMAAQDYLGTAGNSMQTIGAAFASDPSVGAALRKAGEELSKIEGMAVRSTTYVVAVAPDKEFDPQLVLAPKQKESAAKKIGKGLLGGVLGRAAASDQPEQQEDPTQQTMFTFKSEVRDVKTGSVDDSLFEPPAGYRQVDWQTGS